MADKKKKESKKKAVKHNWYLDRYSIAVYQRNFLMIFLMATVCVMFMGVVYINLISQKKTVDPFVVEIEEKSGIPTVVDQKTKTEYTAQEAINNFFIYKYVRARENYDFRDYIYDYFTVVRVLSSGAIFKQFYSENNKRNEQSRVNIFGRKTSIKAKIKSVIDITTKADRAKATRSKQVRLLLQHVKNNRVVLEEHKVIIMKYKFVNLNLEFEERLVNPLGFQVNFYKINDEFNSE
ncbi:MAG: type IV secretion system protein [Rickettsiales bacterium]|nr:type IV secretion system protein [Rickettsiales bacterium]